MISRMTFSGFVRTKVVSCRSGNQPWPMRDSLDDEYVSRALLEGLWNIIRRIRAICAIPSEDVPETHQEGEAHIFVFQ